VSGRALRLWEKREEPKRNPPLSAPLNNCRGRIHATRLPDGFDKDTVEKYSKQVLWVVSDPEFLSGSGTSPTTSQRFFNSI